MPESTRYPLLEATPDPVLARAYRTSIWWALKEIDRVENALGRAMAAGHPEQWYLNALRSELSHTRSFLAALVGANYNLRDFVVAGAGWVQALRALLTEEPQAPLHPPAELTGGSIPEHVPGAYPSLSCCGGLIRLVDNGEWRSEPDLPEFDPGPEVDDEGGMSEYRTGPAFDQPEVPA